MSGTNGLKLLFVINPVAGPGNNSWQDIISNYFTGKSFETDYYILEKTPDTAKLKTHIELTKPDRVIAVGGDGTVTMVAKLIAGSNMALGILPAGSANGMAKELNISSEPEEALAIIENGEIRSCDAIKINEKDICLHLSDIGLNAQLIKYFDEGKVRGKLGYARVLLKTLWNKRKIQVTLQSRNKEIKRAAFMVVIANASKYGTGAVINPEGSLDDGLFEVVVVRKLAVSEFFKMLFRPQPFDPKKIEIFHVTTLVIASRKTVHFQIDGEYMGKVNKIEARILPAYIDFIFPS